MSTRVKSSRLSPPTNSQSAVDLGPTPLTTPAMRREQLLALGERVNVRIRFMCGLEDLAGVSGEAKDKALVAFHERLAALEKELALIEENLHLE